MAERRINRSLHLLVLLAASLLTLTAEAIGLGELSARSSIGQPLDATVDVWLTTKDKSQPLRFKLTPDIAYRANVKMSATVARMSAGLAEAGNGRHYIQIRSDVPIDEPVLAFRLKVYVGDSAIMRNFSLALNPPPAVRTRDVKRTTSRSRLRAPISEPDYTVAAGDTLWAIARRVSLTTGTNVGELVTQIFNDNPQAFVGGDENRLMLGADLRLPVAVTAVAATTPPVIQATVSAAEPSVPASELPGATDTETATSTTMTVEPKNTLATTTRPVAASEAAPATTRKPVDWRQHEPELAAQLEALRLKYIALKAQYDIQHESGSAATAETGLPAVEQSPNVEPATSDVPEVQQSEPPVQASSEAGAAESLAAEDTRMAVESDPIGSLLNLSPAALVAVLFACLAVITLVVISFRKLHTGTRERRAEIEHHAREADFKAQVARKAANRVQMESEVQRMLESREEEPGTAEVSAPFSSVETVRAVGDSDAEIDHNIAHGRYGEAETQLRSVITANPKNFSAKLRLLEVYYMTEDIEPFCELAEDLQANHRADMSDDEWRRVVRMGKMTAPDRVPFSGPRGIENPNEAS